MLIRRYKEWFAIGFIVLVTLLSEYYSFFVTPARELVRDDGAAKWEERMKAVRENLPASVREVGYVSDNDPIAVVEEYSLTRYSLAPIVVRQSTNLEWIVGNSTQSDFESTLHNKITSSFTVKKLGAGIYLIHRSLP